MMHVVSTLRFALLGAIFWFVGCSSEVMGPTEILVDGLRIQLSVSPTVVDRQETFVATLQIENLHNEPVELVSSCTALALIKTFRDGVRVDLEGTVLGCGDAITSFMIDAHGTLVRTYQIRAARWDNEPVERGSYVLVAEFMVTELPDLETTFRVE